MKGLTLQAKIFIFGTMAAGVTLAAINLTSLGLEHAWMVLLLSGMAAISLIFRVDGAIEQLTNDVSFMIYGFALILTGVPETIFIILISSVVEFIWRRSRWYMQAFNIASLIVVTQLSGILYTMINPSMALFNAASVMGVLVTMLIFTLGNHFLIGIVINLIHHENFTQSGVFAPFSLMLDYILLIMGAAAAYIFTLNPIASVLALLPIYLIYTTLKVPMLERKSNTDSKTGLFNAEYFSAALDAEMARAVRFDRPLTVVMADMDLLRNINNTYGHMAGDVALVGIANIIRKSVREYDIVARFGGEEYAILMPETYPAEAYPRIEAIRQAIENARWKVTTSTEPIQATMTFGIAGRSVGSKTQTGNDIVHNADEALFQAKLEGRNRVMVYSSIGEQSLQAYFQQAASQTRHSRE